MFRAREAELERQLQSEMASAEAGYSQKTQDMLTEFGRAQQLLKDKILKQQNMYVCLLDKAHTDCCFRARYNCPYLRTYRVTELLYLYCLSTNVERFITLLTL